MKVNKPKDAPNAPCSTLLPNKYPKAISIKHNHMIMKAHLPTIIRPSNYKFASAPISKAVIDDVGMIELPKINLKSGVGPVSSQSVTEKPLPLN